MFTSFKERNGIEKVTIFPNPTKNHLIIDFKSNVSGKLNINLKNILGTNVSGIYSDNLNSGSNKIMIDLTRLSIKKGIYFAEFIIDEKLFYTEKILVVE